MNLKEYFDKDFSHTLFQRFVTKFEEEDLEGIIHNDFQAYSRYLSIYVPGTNRDKSYFERLAIYLMAGGANISITNITLPRTGTQFGNIRFEKNKNIKIEAELYGETDLINVDNLQFSGRLNIYSETNLDKKDILVIKNILKPKNIHILFKANDFLEMRKKYGVPLAFISHDSRDKEEVARKIATGLENMLCPVWYDEYSLKVGDNLRDSIEKGLKECKKCILILSPNFIENKGWTKTEFDSVFTRQILEKENLILPVWYNVSKEAVYDYSPSLLNIVGLNWDQLGENEVIRELFLSIKN